MRGLLLIVECVVARRSLTCHSTSGPFHPTLGNMSVNTPDTTPAHTPQQTLVLIDNYDSFTYNLVQTFGQVMRGLRIEIFRNDKVTLEQIEAINPTHICISPGPCSPNEAGMSNDVLKHFAPRIPVLGVCLGHQCIAHVYGGVVERAAKLMHGKTDQIFHDGQGVYQGMANPFVATRYHSLIIRPGTLSDTDFVVSAWTKDNEIMGVRHKHWPLQGVQYHPESFLTENGATLLRNFLDQRKV